MKVKTIGKLDHALTLAGEGFKIFPIKQGTKNKPLVRWVKGGHGAQATDDPTIIKIWWTKWPHANMGVATGPSNLLVVDVDMKPGKNGKEAFAMLEMYYAPLPTTREVHTPSGGRHYYFKVQHPVPSPVNFHSRMIGKGIDIRSAGAMVVAPGSEINTGDYSWKDSAMPVAEAPEWLLELFAPGKAGIKSGGQRKTPSEKNRLAPVVPLDEEQAIARAIEFLRQHPVAIEGQGGDHHTYVTACLVKDMGISRARCLALLMEHWDHKCEPPWGEKELKTKVENAYAYGVEAPGVASPMADFESLEPDEDESKEKKEKGKKEYQNLLEQWVWIVKVKCFLRRADSQMWDKEQFESVYGHHSKRSAIWSRIFKSKYSIRRVEGVTYKPGKPEFPECGNYNIWRPSGIHPVPGDVTWLLEHMKYLIPDDRERELVFDYLAYLVQCLGEKIHFALVLQGAQGTGKSFIGRLMERIIGSENVSRPSNAEIQNHWTSWQLRAQLVIIEEFMTHGRQDMANKFKPLITDHTLRIEEKYLRPYTLENCLNFLIFTNHKDAVKIEQGDRRYLVIFSPAVPRSAQYYQDLFLHLEEGGPAHVVFWLSQRDLTGFDAKGVAPETSAKQEMQEATMNPVHAELWALFENEEWPFKFDLVSMSQLRAALSQDATYTRDLNGKLTSFVRDILKAVKLSGIPISKDGTTSKFNLWVWRNQDEWLRRPKAEIGRLYDKAIKK